MDKEFMEYFWVNFWNIKKNLGLIFGVGIILAIYLVYSLKAHIEKCHLIVNALIF